MVARAQLPQVQAGHLSQSCTFHPCGRLRAATFSMLQLPVPAQPVVTSPITVRPDPHAQRRLACRYGTLRENVFVPSVNLDLRVQAAIANGVPETRARIEATLSLMIDEEELRSYEVTWQYLSVHAQ